MHALPDMQRGSDRDPFDKKILVIDDEPGLVDLVKGWLESRGYEVSTAYNGIDGLEKARKEDLNLIILDIMMPEMDGHEVLDRLRADEKTKHIPVIMLTAKRDTDSIIEAQRLGITDYIMKPFGMEELLRMVKKHSWRDW